eukprot:CAMPEP_0170513440 /NCGR_PEP_ID=MMETSP0208-20121228/67399_1 /TAXON_ID=197538 /ORGANISM="Strombidium inclinatum, Strain S3" /LENGTH=197 /DNA_ID=CAMNT_0010797171 /DNA_START=1165 /DNA_END=1758 /DNA_ORIENTATION=+
MKFNYLADDIKEEVEEGVLRQDHVSARAAVVIVLVSFVHEEILDERLPPEDLHELIVDHAHAVDDILVLELRLAHVVGLHGEYECVLADGVLLAVKQPLNFRLMLQLLELDLLVDLAREAEVFHDLPPLAVFILRVHVKNPGLEADLVRALYAGHPARVFLEFNLIVLDVGRVDSYDEEVINQIVVCLVMAESHLRS